jgi:hypothetical protein
MAQISVTVDSTAAENMLAEIGQRAASRDLGFAVGRAADRGAQMISGIPQDTGELARSVRAFGWNIVASARNPRGVPYGRFVFGGTRYMAAQPPSVPTGAIQGILSDEIERVLFR